jgi:hypothetical protein
LKAYCPLVLNIIVMSAITRVTTPATFGAGDSGASTHLSDVLHSLSRCLRYFYAFDVSPVLNCSQYKVASAFYTLNSKYCMGMRQVVDRVGWWWQGCRRFGVGEEAGDQMRNLKLAESRDLTHFSQDQYSPGQTKPTNNNGNSVMAEK